MVSAIKRTSLPEQVLRSVLSYIQDEKLKVGDKLPTEEELSRLFQISRTSVREAMKVLSMNGAVQSIPGRGTFIRPNIMNFLLNENDEVIHKANVSISNLIEVRLALELLAADLAIERATDEDIARVEETMEELRRFVPAKETLNIRGAQLHIRIAECTGNQLLVKLIESYAEMVARYRDALIDDDQNIGAKVNIDEHEAIVAALRARNKKAMRAAVFIHLKDAEAKLKAIVDINNAVDFVIKTTE